MPAVPMSSTLRRRALTGFGRRLRGTDPGDVHGVLQRLSDTERAVQRDQPTDDDGGAVALQTLRLAQLVADDRELAQRRVEDPSLQVLLSCSTKPSTDANSSSSGNSERKP